MGNKFIWWFHSFLIPRRNINFSERSKLVLRALNYFLINTTSTAIIYILVDEPTHLGFCPDRRSLRACMVIFWWKICKFDCINLSISAEWKQKRSVLFQSSKTDILLNAHPFPLIRESLRVFRCPCIYIRGCVQPSVHMLVRGSVRNASRTDSEKWATSSYTRHTFLTI